MFHKAFFFCLLATHLSLVATKGDLIERIGPYLMPENHPIKTKLDTFFTQSRWTFNEKTMEAGGFLNVHPQKFSRAIVTKHPEFSGYVFKVYLDTQRYYLDLPEGEIWARRAEGANCVREVIERMGVHAMMKAPVKWIYRLPDQPKVPKGYIPKRFILVQEDMELVSNEENRKLWKSDFITPELLDKVHYVIKEVGLLDCANVNNIPFSVDGKIAFIDTQTHHATKVFWDSLNRHLNEENRRYWKEITNQK